MRKFALLCVLLIQANGQTLNPNTVIVSEYNCSFLTSTLINTVGGANCGLFPSGFTTQWTFKVQLWTESGTTSGAASNPQTAGTGWCGGPYVSCWNLNTGIDTPYGNVAFPYNSTSHTYTWTDTVTSTPPGGLAGMLGEGCAFTTVAILPSPALVVNAIMCRSINGSPIILDTYGEGFHLTGPDNGVAFRETNGGPVMKMSWTDPAYHNGWLMLPRNGRVTALEDMFGNFTAQPSSTDPNGYLALATYDLNHDGVIDGNDPVYERLRLWIDSNHDGVSQPSELHTLPEVGVTSLKVAYGESRWVDRWGNQFLYKSLAGDHKDKHDYDVFLLTKPL